MVVTEGDPANPTTLLTRQQRGAAITSSYDEEKAALLMALEWLSPSHAATVICSDSQSFRKAIQSGSADTADLRRMVNKRAGLLAMRRRMPELSKRQPLPTVLPDLSPSPQLVHSSVER